MPDRRDHDRAHRRPKVERLREPGEDRWAPHEPGIPDGRDRGDRVCLIVGRDLLDQPEPGRRRRCDREPHQQEPQGNDRRVVGASAAIAPPAAAPSPEAMIVVRRPSPNSTRPRTCARGTRRTRTRRTPSPSARPSRRARSSDTAPTTCPSIPQRGTPTARRRRAATARGAVRTPSQREARLDLGGAPLAGAPRRVPRRREEQAEGAANSIPIRKLVSVASTSPATAAPVMPPTAYIACSHCRTGLRVIASTRWPSMFKNTSISPFPAPAIANASQSPTLGRSAIPRAPTPRVIRPSAQSDAEREAGEAWRDERHHHDRDERQQREQQTHLSEAQAVDRLHAHDEDHPEPPVLPERPVAGQEGRDAPPLRLGRGRGDGLHGADDDRFAPLQVPGLTRPAHHGMLRARWQGERFSSSIW